MAKQRSRTPRPPTPARHPTAVDALFADALTKHQAGRLDEAQSLYHDVLTINPQHADALNMQGVIALQRGDADAGVQLIRLSLASNGRNARAHYNLGLALQSKRDRAGALKAFRRAASLEPGFVEAHNNIGGLLLEEGDRLDEAIRALKKAITLNPNVPDAHNNMAVALKRRGKLDDALAAIERALAVDGAHAPSLNTRATILLEQGDPAGAKTALRRALKRAPNDPSLLTNLGLALKDQGDLAEAEASFRKAIAARADYAEAHTNLGICLQRRSALTEALDAFEEAAVHAPDDPIIHRNLGGAHLRLGDGVQALEHDRRALALDESDAPTWQAYADALAMAATQSGDLAALWDDLARCAASRVIDHTRLAPAPGELIRNRAQAREMFDAGRTGQFSLNATDAARGGFVEALGGKTLIALLRRCVFTHAELTSFLGVIRHALLMLAVEDRLPEAMAPRSFAFICALAEQCFLTGYALAVRADEEEALPRFREKLAGRFLEHDPLPRAAIALYGCYAPLTTLPDEAALRGLAPDDADEPFRHLIVRQIIEPNRDAEAAARLAPGGHAAIAPIHPRWSTIVPEGPQPLGTWLHEQFPTVGATATGAPTIMVLGCGTGAEAVRLARRHPGARVVALDENPAALAYGMRMAEDTDAPSIDWRCGPLRDALGDATAYDLVCAETPSPLPDRAGALTALRDSVTPHGVIRLRLRSVIAGKVIDAAREAFAAFGERDDPAAIRAFRRHVVAAPLDAPFKPLMAQAGFFTVSGCMALLAEEPADRTSLEEMAALLDASSLRFLGFEWPGLMPLDSYRAAYPDDPDATRLDLWAAFEETHPETFETGYLMWVRPTAA